MFGILTGTLTNDIITANNPSPPDMVNKKVGVLNYRDYDAALVAKHGGIIVHNKLAKNFYEDALSLILMLKRQEVDGFLFDKFTLLHAIETLRNASATRRGKHTEALNYLETETILTEKIFPRRKLSYGVLFKNVTDYEYFHEVAISNNVFYETIIDKALVGMVKDFEHLLGNGGSLFRLSGSYFINAMKYIAIIFAVIITFGILYELVRRKVLRCDKSFSETVEDEINELTATS